MVGPFELEKGTGGAVLGLITNTVGAGRQVEKVKGVGEKERLGGIGYLWRTNAVGYKPPTMGTSRPHKGKNNFDKAGYPGKTRTVTFKRRFAWGPGGKPSSDPRQCSWLGDF